MTGPASPAPTGQDGEGMALRETLRHRVGMICGRAVDRWCVRGYGWGTFRNGFAAGYERRHAQAGTVHITQESAALDKLAADVRTVLDQEVMHSHSRPGIWDADNRPELAGTPCEECAARERLADWLSQLTSPTP